ncbi:unnamed protein product [Symbiodinium sp. CCMP2592]|nr:unnamed protein product [Symbiodinium sp. CCMP2592]CAE7797325.1 unnamed protein product [Symbiodinium sp. CCMP2592]
MDFDLPLARAGLMVSMAEPRSALAILVSVALILTLFAFCAGRSTRSTVHGGSPVGPPTPPLLASLLETLPNALQHVIPQELERLLPPLLEAAIAASLPGPSSSADATDNTSVNLAVDTVRDVVEQALDAKWGAMRPASQRDLEQAVTTLNDHVEKLVASRYADFEEILQKQASGLTRQLLDKHKDTQTAMDGLKQLLQNLQQTFALANKTEQGRFQTLETALKGAMEVQETNVKARIDLLNSDVASKLTSLDTNQAKFEVHVAKLEGLMSKLESLPGKFATFTDRVESAIRDRTTSLQQDVNKNLGMVEQMGKDQMGLTRRLTSSLDSLQAATANMGAALGAPPSDSPGVKDIQNLLKDVAAQTASLSDALHDVVKDMKDLKDRPRTASPPSGTAMGSADVLGAAIPQPVPPQTVAGTMPAVIDLSSRIPARPTAQNTQWATLILANGKRMLVSEDDVIGAQQGPAFMQMR